MQVAKNLAVVLWDNSTDQWQDLADRMMDFTRFRLSDIERHQNLNCWRECKDIDQTLRELPDHIEWAVVFTSGNQINTADIVPQLLDVCINKQSPLAGHIIARHGYYHLHPQCFCINVTLYKQFGGNLTPGPGPVSLQSPLIERSEDNVHDDYTPWWVRPDGTECSTLHLEHDNFAQSFIAYLMQQGHSVVNIPNEIRHQKSYSYVDYCHNDIRKFIDNIEYKPGVEGGISQFLDYMRWTQDALTNGFYVLNSEPFVSVDLPADSITSFAGVCGGIKPAMIVAQPAFSRNCRVVLFDISPMAIAWQQHLRQHWNGRFENLESVLNSFIAEHPACRPSYFHHLGIMGTAEWFMKDRFTADQVYEAWQHWLTLDVEYVCCNFLEDAAQDSLLEKLQSTPGFGYIWTSNLFSMDWMMFFYGQKWSHERNRRWMDRAAQSNRPMVVENLQSVNVYNN